MWSPMGIFSLEKPQLGPIAEQDASVASSDSSSSCFEDDMQDILNVDTQGSRDNEDLSDDSSIDSIIKRVEEEIDNARKARRGNSRDEKSQSSSTSSTSADQDMQDILAIDDYPSYQEKTAVVERESVLPDEYVMDDIVEVPLETETPHQNIAESLEKEGVESHIETAKTEKAIELADLELNIYETGVRNAPLISQQPEDNARELLTPLANNLRGSTQNDEVSQQSEILQKHASSSDDHLKEAFEAREPAVPRYEERDMNKPRREDFVETSVLSVTNTVPALSQLPPKRDVKSLDDATMVRSETSSKSLNQMSPSDLEERAMSIIEYHVQKMSLRSAIPRTTRYSQIPSPRARKAMDASRLHSPTFSGASLPSVGRKNKNALDTSSSASPMANGPFGHRLRGKMFRRPERPEEVKSQEAVIKSRKIRFHDQYPVLKPPDEITDSGLIIHRHTVQLPALKSRYSKPKNNLKQLIVAAMGPSLHRRSHACGALKVMLQTQRNQMQLARTSFFLHALVFSAGQDIPFDEDREIAVDARIRATHCLKLVCEAKQNRPLVIVHPGLVECLLKVIDTDDEDARLFACEALVLLAKTPSCRSSLARHKTMFDTLARLMYPLHHEIQCTRSSKMSNATMSTFDETTTLDKIESSDIEPSDHEDEEAIEFTIEKVKSIQERDLAFKSDFFRMAQAATCAFLLHLSKDCMSAEIMHFSDNLLGSLLAHARENGSTLRPRCLEILANFSRLPTNNTTLTIYPELIEVLVEVLASPHFEDRLWALRCFINLSSDSTSKRRLATNAVIEKLIIIATSQENEEKELAVATLYNIITDPGAVIAIANCHNVVASLVYLAHDTNSPNNVRDTACEALSIISLWFQTVAGSGSIPDGLPNVPLPTLKSLCWECWQES